MSQSVERFQNSQWKKLEKINYSKRTILELLKEGTVLDVGCGDGLLLEHLQKNGLKCSGIDISSAAIAICKSRGLNCQQGDITEQLPFADNSFDNVLLIDVLEHLFQPKEVLREAHRITSSSVFISVPNFGALPARLQMLFGRVPENNTPRDGHVYWMTWDVIQGLLADTGFEIVATAPNSFWEDKPVIKHVTGWLKKVWPSVFALSFIIKARKKA